MTTVAEKLEKHLQECAAQNLAVDTKLATLVKQHADLTALMEGIKRIAWRGFSTLVTIVITAAVGLAVQSLQNHREASKKADQDVAASTYVTTREGLEREARLMKAIKEGQGPK